nr:hypothetical protein [Desulfonema ishimotonii]
MPETDAIFENIREENKKADNSPDILRISADVKAKVRVGRFSRGGKARRLCPESAPDHDYAPDAVLAPFGVLETDSGQVSIIFGESKETSDFIADALERWYEIRKRKILKYKELLINLDNGPSLASNRTRFLKRMVMFAKKTGKIIHLVYYPPYHSKYNAIERFRGALEKYWNGKIPDKVKKVFRIAEKSSWENTHHIVDSLKKSYKTGVRPTEEEIEKYGQYIQRSESLPKWDVYIFPNIAN